MFDKSNFYDLMPSGLIASRSLFNTQNPGIPSQKDLLKSSISIVFIEDLFYYNQRLLSTLICIYYKRKSSQFITPKPLCELPGIVIKSVKSIRDFFAIFFDEKEKQHPLLANFIQTNPHELCLEFIFNSDIVCILWLQRAIIIERCVNSGEPAAKVVLPIHSRVIDRFTKREAAAGSLFFATDLHKTNT